nr:partitioning defective 3 homolog B [Halyomorpha halys]
MKVTVCFGPVRVIVPCGDGEILVKDLIRQAVHRYKKATGKGSDNWVAVHSLQTQRDGGILDPDDRLYDVADDREQIIANFGEGPGSHGGGDGASSAGTSSPDIFVAVGEKGGTDIEVTDEQIASGIPGPLQVRRGSEPALNQILVNGSANGEAVGGPPVSTDASKRWSAAPLITEPRSSRKEDRDNGRDDRWITLEEEDPVTLRPPPAFARDGSNRLSIQFFGDNGYRWSDAADKAILHNRLQSLSLPREHKRREPLGQAHGTSPQPTESLSERSEFISLETGGGSLGLHVVPDYDSLGGERGLLVQGVEPGGKVDLDGRLAVGDRVVEINGANLLGQPFSVVQEIFRDSLRCPELRLKVVKGGGLGSVGRSSSKKQPPPTLPKPTSVGLTQERAEPINMIGSQERCVIGSSKVAMTRKVPAAGASLQTGNTRKLGKKVEICLTKGDYGLGFSVTTRDNPAGGHAPIYIKNILPKGAAVEDGRLRPGDRLLAVDGVDLTGKTQADVVAMLRNVPPGSSVSLTVSRQHSPSASSDGMMTPEMTSSTPSPNIMKTPDKEQLINHVNHSSKSDDGENTVYPWRQREILTLDIPVHESEKAGLGVSVKGKTSAGVQGSQSSTPLDLGIFVKSVLHGGAASRDGRLKTNDQLLSVNGVSLVGESNSVAMETLRRALLRSEGPVPGHITLTVARKLHRSDSISSLLTDSSANTETFGCRIDDSSSSQPPATETSGNSENSDNTVIYVPPYKAQLENTLAMRNPVVDRLTSQSNNLSHHLSNPLRNESYYRATHQTSILLNNGKLVSPTINIPPQESVIIEDELPYNSNQHRNGDHEKMSNGQQRNSTSSSQTNDITYASQLSLDEGGGFARDAFGRQSMSEKRHAALDAKTTDTYQRNKKAREERERATREQRLYRVNSAESVAKSENNNNDPNIKPQLGPALGMKKSSSLESLQTMVQELQMTEEEGGGYRAGQTGVRIVRGRGCNESFRAAVDRLDPLAEDEDSPLGRQPSLNTSLESKSSKGKKRPSLLKGIGSMFRFGAKRKDSIPTGNPEDEKEAARRAAKEEQERIQEQYRRLLMKQHEYQQQQQQLQQQQQQQQRDKQQQLHIRVEDEKYSSLPTNEPSRTERINQLRLEHQRRHSERRGHYPLDEREEVYEHHLKQKLENGEIENAMTRPGSRVGITDPSRFSHYVNYHEIQQHLKEEIAAVKLRRPKSQKEASSSDESRRQQHYHSQRAAQREPVHRPVSNFYEYESVQAVLRGETEAGSLPRRPGEHITLNGYNPVGRYSSGFGYPSQMNGLPYSAAQYQARPYKPGPFVTHVTIRETQPKV